MSTLANCWKNLLQDQDIEAELKEFEAKKIHRLLLHGRERGLSVGDIRDWLKEQQNNPGFQVITKNEIVAFVTNPKEKNSSEDEDEVLVKKVKLSTLRIYIDALVDYTIYSTIPETTSNYGSLRMLREIIIKESHQVGRQTKVTNFSPVCRSTSPASDNPEPGAKGEFEGFTSDSEAMDHE